MGCQEACAVDWVGLSLAAGRSSVAGVGTFYSKERQEGQVKHITSGKMVIYPARRVAAFRVGEVLKRAVRGERRTSRGRPRSEDATDD